MTKFFILPAALDQLRDQLEATIQSQGRNPGNFNLDGWLQEWLQQPQPALGGAIPAQLLDTADGIEVVRRALSAVITGANR